MSAQYGEDAVLEGYFKGRGPGFFVDVGAADGVDNSNTFNLAQRNWKGILIEPNPSDYQKLCNLYSNNPRFTILNMAVYSSPGEKTFYYERGQSSTLSKEFRDRVINIHKAKYQETIVKCDTLISILDGYACPKTIDFMSVDAEGVDMIVLKSMNWNSYFVDLVCVEHSMPKEELKAYMESEGFLHYTETAGNTLFINTRKKS